MAGCARSGPLDSPCSAAVQAPRSRWAPIAGFALASSANQMAWLAFAPVTTGAAAHFRVSTSTIGLLSEIFPLLYVILAMPAGRAVDRSLRNWLGTGAVLSAAGTVLRLAGTSRSGFAWVLAGQVVVAAAQPLLLNSVTALARRYLAPADRPVGIAICSAGTFLGFVLAFVTGAAIGAARVNDLLVLGAVYALAGGAVLVVALARTPCPFGGERPSSLAGLAELRQLVGRPCHAWLGVLRLRRLWGLRLPYDLGPAVAPTSRREHNDGGHPAHSDGRRRRGELRGGPSRDRPPWPPVARPRGRRCRHDRRVRPSCRRPRRGRWDGRALPRRALPPARVCLSCSR